MVETTRDTRDIIERLNEIIDLKVGDPWPASMQAAGESGYDNGWGGPLRQLLIDARSYAVMQKAQPWHLARLRRLVDIVWNEATESTAVPSTDWADRLIVRAISEDVPRIGAETSQ